MKKNKPAVSFLWEYINRIHFSKRKVGNLSTFRSEGVNYKIALFEPESNGRLYLLTLINQLSKSLSTKNWEAIHRTENRTLVGKPITVNVNGEAICLDYLQAVLELEFISNNIDTNKVNRVLEIGAGYGRTCHVLLSNLNIKKYFIVDLGRCLMLSKNYLKQILNEELFSKIVFVDVDDVETIVGLSFDLCINIDSFSEMPRETVCYYLDYIDQHCAYLYTKNPVCNNVVKPWREQASWYNFLMNKIYNKAAIAISKNMMLPEVLDIFNASVISEQAKKFIQVYTPSGDWECICHAWSPPWLNYWQVIYGRKMNNI